MDPVLFDPASKAVLLNAFFIFLSLVFSTTVAAVVAYRIRMPGNVHIDASSQTSEAEKHTTFSPKQVSPFLTAHELENVDPSLEFNDHAQTPGDESKGQRPGYVSHNQIPGISQTFSSFGYVFGPVRSKASSFSPPHHIDLIQKESSVFSHRLRYTDTDMRSFHSPQILAANESLKLTRLLQFEGCFPAPQFDSMKVATDAVREVELTLCENDSSSRALGLFQLAAIGGSWGVYDNPIYYLENFCRLVEKQMHGPNWLKPSASISGLQMMLVDLVVCFSWSHWNWNDLVSSIILDSSIATSLESSAENGYAQALSKIMEYYKRGETTPFLLPRLAIFRLLSNLYLLISQLARTCPSEAKLKLGTVFHVCATNTKCYEHRQLLPLVSQSVLVAENESIKVFFYDIASEIIRPHLGCCIEIQDVFYPRSDLQGLVLQGLWVGQPLGVRAKAAYLARLLGKKYPEVNLWSEPVNRNENAVHMPDASNVPGSWMK